MYTRAYLSLLPSILGIFFSVFHLSQLNSTNHVFSHIVQFIAWGCWGARLQILTLAVRLVWNCRTYAQKTYRSRWLLRSRWATSSTNEGSSSLFVPFKNNLMLVPCNTHVVVFLGGDYYFYFLIRIALQCFYLSDADKGMVCDLCKGIFLSSCHL